MRTRGMLMLGAVLVAMGGGLCSCKKDKDGGDSGAGKENSGGRAGRGNEGSGEQQGNGGASGQGNEGSGEQQGNATKPTARQLQVRVVEAHRTYEKAFHALTVATKEKTGEAEAKEAFEKAKQEWEKAEQEWKTAKHAVKLELDTPDGMNYSIPIGGGIAVPLHIHQENVLDSSEILLLWKSDEEHIQLLSVDVMGGETISSGRFSSHFYLFQKNMEGWSGAVIGEGNGDFDFKLHLRVDGTIDKSKILAQTYLFNLKVLNVINGRLPHGRWAPGFPTSYEKATLLNVKILP